jgi:hypothetical protein
MSSDLGFVRSVRRLVVLVDHAAEYLPPPNRRVRRNADLVVLVGRSLLAGLASSGAVLTLVEDVHVAHGHTAAPGWTVTVPGYEAAHMPGIAGFPALPR